MLFRSYLTILSAASPEYELPFSSSWCHSSQNCQIKQSPPLELQPCRRRTRQKDLCFPAPRGNKNGSGAIWNFREPLLYLLPIIYHFCHSLSSIFPAAAGNFGQCANTCEPVRRGKASARGGRTGPEISAGRGILPLPAGGDRTCPPGGPVSRGEEYF